MAAVTAKASAAQQRADLRRVWKALTPAMRRAMDEAADRPLQRSRAGWSSKGFAGHSPNTIEALEKRGLLSIDRMAGCCGVARISQYGKSVFGSVGEPLDPARLP